MVARFCRHTHGLYLVEQSQHMLFYSPSPVLTALHVSHFLCHTDPNTLLDYCLHSKPNVEKSYWPLNNHPSFPPCCFTLFICPTFSPSLSHCAVWTFLPFTKLVKVEHDRCLEEVFHTDMQPNTFSTLFQTKVDHSFSSSSHWVQFMSVHCGNPLAEN